LRVRKILKAAQQIHYHDPILNAKVAWIVFSRSAGYSIKITRPVAIFRNIDYLSSKKLFSRMQKTINSILFFLLSLLAIGIGLYALSYYAMKFPFLQTKGTLPSQWYWSLAFYIHTGSGGIALGIGWLQFREKFRLKNIKRHRFIGKIYVTAILFFASTSGQFLAWFSNEGFPAHLGFACLSLVWFYTTLSAYLAIRRNIIPDHRAWMARSYAITFAAVTLRIWFPLFQYGFHFSQQDAYIAVSWFCWVPNILVAEWFIVNKMGRAQ
jgi:uncharacterized membrane protein